ncbi:MAG: hypothetical protein WA373_02155 [Burkholderiales bacterium]
MPIIEIERTSYLYDKAPDHCPICHHGIKAVMLGTNVVQRRASDGSILQLLYRCPRDTCQRAFIGTYQQERNRSTHYPDGDFLLRNTAPYHAEEPDIPQEIRGLSPNYYEIFGQSMAAEAFQLNQIAGCGYRKALEFLIKDYAIHKHSIDTETIKAKLLGACIKEYVNDANVKACATRAAWLGNDETHYLRKWEEKDITDLKILIRLTAAWVLNELLTEKYLRDMQ